MSRAKSKTTTKGRKAEPANPDAKLIRLGTELRQHIEAAYPHHLASRKARAPLTRLEAKMRRKKDPWDAMEKVRRKFDATAAGRKQMAAFNRYCVASAKADRTAQRILQGKPRSVAGLAAFALAGAYDNLPGYGYPIDSRALALITQASARAAGVKLPAPMARAIRRTVQS